MVLELRWQLAFGDQGTPSFWLVINFLGKMTNSYFKIEEKLNDASNFAAWRDILDLTLEENDVIEYVQGKVVELGKILRMEFFLQV